MGRSLARKSCSGERDRKLLALKQALRKIGPMEGT